MSLANAIMTALIDDELTGYELAKRFETSLGFFWHASHQQIYRELKALTHKQYVHPRLVVQNGRPDKTVYQLTKVGQRCLDDWIVRSAKPRPVKDELFIKLYNLSSTNVNELREQVQIRRATASSNLVLYRRIRERRYANPCALSNRLKGVAMVLDAGIRDAEATIHWCDASLDMMADIGALGSSNGAEQLID